LTPASTFSKTARYSAKKRFVTASTFLVDGGISSAYVTPL